MRTNSLQAWAGPGNPGPVFFLGGHRESEQVMGSTPTRVAIQGIRGSFHEEAAESYFEQAGEVVCTGSVEELFAALARRDADYGVMAIENTVAGSILPNYALLRESGMRVVGETYLRIALNLVSFPGQSLADLVEVYSHPMAINQCRVFFRDRMEEHK